MFNNNTGKNQQVKTYKYFNTALLSQLFLKT